MSHLLSNFLHSISPTLKYRANEIVPNFVEAVRRGTASSWLVPWEEAEILLEEYSLKGVIKREKDGAQESREDGLCK